MHWHMYGFQWHFGVIFPSQDTIWSIILFTMYYFTEINIAKYLFIPTLYGNLKFHDYSIHTIPNTAGSESFTESHSNLRKDKFTTNSNLWHFSVLNRSINSTLTRFIIKLAYNNYQFLFFISLVVSKINTGYIWSHTKEKPYQRNHCESPSHRKSRPLVVFSSFA